MSGERPRARRRSAARRGGAGTTAESRRAWLLVGGALLVLLGVVVGRWTAADDVDDVDGAVAPVVERPVATASRGAGAPVTAAAGDVPAPATDVPPAPVRGEALVALVIDDLGRSVETVDRLSALGIELSYSVLPFESRTPQVVDRLRGRDAEILLHLPMEAAGGADPGPGSLSREMEGDELRRRTREALAAVPGAVGVNNHMGSALSSDGRALEPVLLELRQQGVFFLDSRTTADSVGFQLARELGIPAAERRVFLDGEIDREEIRAQFRQLLADAAERGSAIAIGHPYDETLEVLAEEVPRAREAGFRFVPVSFLLERTGVDAM